MKLRPGDEDSGFDVGILTRRRMAKLIPPDVKLDVERLLIDAMVECRAFEGRPPGRVATSVKGHLAGTMLLAVISGSSLRELGVPFVVGTSLGLAVGGTLSAVFSFPKNVAQRSAVRRVLRRHGVPTCTRCGYDLRPTPVVVCCPECGEANLHAGSEGPS